MKKVYLTSISAFSIGTLLVIGILISMYFNNPVHSYSQEAHADWPYMDIDELVKEADLIAYVHSDEAKVTNLSFNDGESLDAQLTDLKVKEVLKGDAADKIVLNQALDFVEKDESYLVFLTKGDDELYYELTDKAILLESNGKFSSQIEGFSGSFSLNEINSKVNEIVTIYK